MKFQCVQDCSECCIERQYYPSKKYGKIGVLILPEEKQKIMELAEELGLKITILPRIGVSSSQSSSSTTVTENKPDSPSKVLAYQLMGIEENGNTCPFLATHSDKKSPHGGRACMIYEKRPLACRAYPVISSDPVMLDEKCKFCQQHGQTKDNLHSEMESLIKIKSSMEGQHAKIWRYATGIGEKEDMQSIETGWVEES